MNGKGESDMRIMRVQMISLPNPFRIKRHALLSLVLFLSAVPAVFAIDVQQTGSDEVKQLRKQALKLVRKGDLVEAERFLRRAVEIDPKATAARVDLAFVLTKQRRLQEAYDLSFAIALEFRCICRPRRGASKFRKF